VILSIIFAQYCYNYLIVRIGERGGTNPDNPNPHLSPRNSEEIMKNKLFVVLSVSYSAAMVLSACAPKAAEETPVLSR